MNLTEFGLAASTNDLKREVDARDAADLVEFRMDSADDPMQQLSEYDGDLPIIATNRAEWFGGYANNHGRLDYLFKAAQFDSVEIVDIELETARGNPWILNEFRENDVEVIISVHEFDNTPDQETLVTLIEECAQYGDIAKVATFATDRADTVEMLGAISETAGDGLRVAGLSMGESGSIVRVIAPFYGSVLGYAPLKSDPDDYAPGQIPLDKLDFLINQLEEIETETGAIRDIEESVSYSPS